MFAGWGKNRTYADGITRISSTGSILALLRQAKNAPPNAREGVLRDLKAVLKVKTEAERVQEKIKEAAAARNRNVNNLNIELPE